MAVVKFHKRLTYDKLYRTPVSVLGSLPGTWLRDKDLVRSHHLSRHIWDSGYKANSFACTPIIPTMKTDVNSLADPFVKVCSLTGQKCRGHRLAFVPLCHARDERFTFSAAHQESVALQEGVP